MADDFTAAHTALTEEREKLIRQLGDLGATESGDLRSDLDFGESFADAGAMTAERTEVLGLVDTLKRRLDSVDAALGRIDDGSYGVCARCSGEISAARMEARPESVLCMDCKSKQG